MKICHLKALQSLTMLRLTPSNLKQQRLHWERETWFKLRGIGYSGLIRDPDMTWWKSERETYCYFLISIKQSIQRLIHIKRGPQGTKNLILNKSLYLLKVSDFFCLFSSINMKKIATSSEDACIWNFKLFFQIYPPTKGIFGGWVKRTGRFSYFV